MNAGTRLLAAFHAACARHTELSLSLAAPLPPLSPSFFSLVLPFPLLLLLLLPSGHRVLFIAVFTLCFDPFISLLIQWRI